MTDIEAKIHADTSIAEEATNSFFDKVRTKMNGLGREFDKDTKKRQEEQEKLHKTQTSLITTGRRVAQLGFATSQAFGFAIDQTLQLGIEAGMLLIESYVKASEFAATEAGLGNPLALLRVEANIAAATSMGMTILALQQSRTELSQRMNAATGAFRLLTF